MKSAHLWCLIARDWLLGRPQGMEKTTMLWQL
jgi:hypothetical protein